MLAILTPLVSVSQQIMPKEVAALAKAGFVALINNRPDGESPGQPTGAEIAAAASAAGLSYTAIPVDHHGIGPAQVQAMAEALESASGPVLAFCRSGTRSTHLWALAEASRGAAVDELVSAAADAGYDISMTVPLMRQLGGK